MDSAEMKRKRKGLYSLKNKTTFQNCQKYWTEVESRVLIEIRVMFDMLNKAYTPTINL